MCRIASLYLLQRLKGSMSGEARDFKNIETRVVIKFFFPARQSAEGNHAILKETLGEHAQSYATVKHWVAQVKCGDFSTCDAPRPARPKTVTTPEISDQIHELILEDRRISVKSTVSNWASHVSGLGPLFMKIWTGGSSPRSGSRNAWTRIKIVDNAPAHRALAIQKKLAYLRFQCLDHPPYSRVWSRRATTCSLDWKNNWKVAIFRPTRRLILPRRPGWTTFWIFLSGLQKLQQRAKKCSELRGGILNKSRVGRSRLLPSWSGYGLISTPSYLA